MTDPLAGAADRFDVPARAMPIATSIASKIARILFSPTSWGSSVSVVLTTPPVVPSLLHSKALGNESHNRHMKTFVPTLAESILIIWRQGVHPWFICSSTMRLLAVLFPGSTNVAVAQALLSIERDAGAGGRRRA
jgi:hypothetical protein